MRLSSVTGSAWSSTRRLWYIRGDRHTLGEQRQPLTPELGVHARLGGDRPAPGPFGPRAEARLRDVIGEIVRPRARRRLPPSGPRCCGECPGYLYDAWLLGSWGSPPRLPMILSEVFTSPKDAA